MCVVHHHSVELVVSRLFKLPKCIQFVERILGLLLLLGGHLRGHLHLI